MTAREILGLFSKRMAAALGMANGGAKRSEVEKYNEDAYDEALKKLEQDLVGLLPEKKHDDPTKVSPVVSLVAEGYNQAIEEVENAIRNYVRGE